MFTRRETIGQLGGVGAAMAFGRRGGATAAAADYTLADWTGDSFAPMHAIRDGFRDRPLAAPERRVEVAVVGGGLSGLAAATLLRDLDLVVLEREQTPGGAARSGRWRSVEYALGSAYIVDLEAPFGPFYETLGLRPTAVPEPVNRFPNAAFTDMFDKELRKPFAELQTFLARLASGADFPDLPIENASTGALALDRMSLLAFLRRESVDPRLFDFIDAYCLSALGAPATEVSAYAGVNFLSEFASNIYAFPGGNGALARRMVSRVEEAGAGRMITGAAVYAIEPSEGGDARVGWFDVSSGETRCISARWVILAAPYFFAARILRGLKPAAAAQMARLRQGSFLVANCCFEGSLPEGAYDCWPMGARAFADAVDASAILGAERPKDHGVLTLYAPFRDPGLGRARLLEGDREAIAAQIVEELRRFMPESFSRARLAEVRLTRWGHHHLIAAPGIVETMRSLPKRVGNVLLSHSDGQAMPAAESAIMEAHRAAAVILGR